MRKNKKFDENAWYVSVFVGFVAMIFGFYLMFPGRYDHYLSRASGDMPSGKGAKIFLLLVKVLDKFGGHLLSECFIFSIALYAFYIAYKRYKNRYK